MKITLKADGTPHILEARPTLLETLLAAGLWNAETPCGGKGICGKCRVEILDGDSWKSALACRTEPVDGMKLRLPHADPIQLAEACADAGIVPDALPYASDGDLLGLAVDIGTTTVAAALYDLRTGRRLATAGEANAQRVCGADVISRIEACSGGGLGTLSELIRAQISKLAKVCCDEAAARTEDIKRIAVAGNTVMEHIFCALSPEGIGRAPFKPLSLFGENYPASGLGLPAADGAQVFVAPAVSGYVGGDITAGLLTVGPDPPFLFLDLGTNGEMVLSYGGRLRCCSAAAGPAFEGAGVSCGMSGSPGAIDSVTARGSGFDYTVIGGGTPKGICGSGLADALAMLLERGAVDDSGRLLAPREAPQLLDGLGKDENGTFFELAPSVRITEKDVRALQLAKAAVRAGAEVLLRTAGATPENTGRLIIAGGFGSYIKPASALRIGLLPKGFSAAQSCGNSSLTGAARMLLSGAERERSRALAKRCRYIELSVHPGFTDAFMSAMDFEA
jgi:uncharacterized 2Fe-2S/4Fe-4S cluster protein (DUF4445 family)